MVTEKNYASEFARQAGDRYIGSGVAKPSKKITRQFTFTLTNTTGVDQTIAIYPGDVDTHRAAALDANKKYKAIGGGLILKADGAQLDIVDRFDNPAKFATNGIAGVTAVLDDGTIYTADEANKLTAVAKSYSIQYFLDFLKAHASVLESITINSDQKNVFDGQIEIWETNPFKTSKETLQLNDFLDLKDFQTTKIIVNPSKQRNMLVGFDKQTVMTMTLPGLTNGVANVKATVQVNLSHINDIDTDFFEAVAGN